MKCMSAKREVAQGLCHPHEKGTLKQGLPSSAPLALHVRLCLGFTVELYCAKLGWGLGFRDELPVRPSKGIS